MGLPVTFTVELWLEVVDTPFYGVLVDARTELDQGWVLDVGIPSSSYPNQISLGWGTGNLIGPDISELAPAWYHIAFTRNTMGITTCWIDGELASQSMTNEPVMTPSPISVGRYRFGDADTNYWWRGGSIDDIHIMNTAKYSDDFSPTKINPEDESILFWAFDEGQGEVAVDAIQQLELHLDSPAWTEGFDVEN